MGEKKVVPAAQQGAHSAGSLEPTISDFYLKIKARGGRGDHNFVSHKHISALPLRMWTFFKDAG